MTEGAAGLFALAYSGLVLFVLASSLRKIYPPMRAALTAFVLSVAVGFLFTAAGLPIVGNALGPGLADVLAAFSLLSHFEAAQRGVLELRSLLFYLGFIALWLSLNTIWVSARKGG